MATAHSDADAGSTTEQEQSEKSTLSLSLRFAQGAAQVSAAPARLGPIALDAMVLRIDKLTFPFDMSNGAHGFRHRHTTAMALAWHIDAAALAQLFSRVDWPAYALQDVQVSCQAGYLALYGVADGGADAPKTPFCARLALRPVGQQDCGISVYDVRFFGAAVLDESGLAQLLQQAFCDSIGAAAKAQNAQQTHFSPARFFAHVALPAIGWRIAKTAQLQWQRLEVCADGIHVAWQGADLVATQKTRARVQLSPLPPAADRALVALQAMADVLQARAAKDLVQTQVLLQKAIDAADASDSSRLARDLSLWARRQQLELCARVPSAPNWDSLVRPKDPPEQQVALALQQLAWTQRFAAAAGTSREVQAAAQARQLSKQWSSKASNTSAVLPLEAWLVRLAAAGLEAQQAPARAVADLAQLDGLQLPYAFALAFVVHGRLRDKDAQMQAAHNWLQALHGPSAAGARADVHVEIATRIAGGPDTQTLEGGAQGEADTQPPDAALARRHLLAALGEVPEHAAAQAQLAIVDAAHQQLDSAQKLLAALEAQAEQMAKPQAASDTWLHAARAWLQGFSDRPAARRCLHAALARCEEHQASLLLLAQMAEEDGDYSDACALLEQLARQGSLSRHAQIDVHLRLVEHAVRLYGPSGAADSAESSRMAHHLEQALQLAPERDDLRSRLVAVLTDMQAYKPLAALLESSSARAAGHGDFQCAQQLLLQAATLSLGPAQAPQEARRLLQQLLQQKPSHTEALQLLLPLLRGAEHFAEASAVLRAASKASDNALQRGAWLASLAQLAEEANQPNAARIGLWREVLQCLPQHLLAAQAQVTLLQGEGRRSDVAHDIALAQAYEQLAYASAASRGRAQAFVQAARALIWADQLDGAERTLHNALQAGPSDVDVWLLAVQLQEQRGAEPQALRALLQRALHECENQAQVHLLCRKNAELCAACNDDAGEAQAWAQVITQGGSSAAHCERLLAALARLKKPMEQAQWLMAWADAGWPLAVGEAYVRAAELSQAHDLQLCQKALRRAIACGGERLWQAAAMLERLANQHGWSEDGVLALEGQLQAIEEGYRGHSDVRALEVRLMWAHRAHNDWAAAESVCVALLQDDPHSAPCHVLLAELLLRRHQWEEALDHFAAALLGPGVAALGEQALRDNLQEACALAVALRPELLEKLHAVHKNRFGGGEQPTPERFAYVQRLAERGDTDGQEAFLRYLLEHDPSAAERLQLRLQWAELLLQQRQDAAQAQVLLRQNLQEDARHLPSREALLPVLEALGAQQELAELHFALSQLVQGPTAALEHVLHSAGYFAGKSDGRGMAADIIAAFAQRHDVPRAFPPLWQGLRKLGLLRELEQLLCSSLEAQPAVDDGRFTELVRLLAGPRQAPERALVWCETYQGLFASDDRPFALHLEVLLPEKTEIGTETRAAAEQVYRAWADARQGEARASILDALAQHLRDAGQPSKALHVLEAALAVPDATPQRALARLETLTERYLARGQWSEAAASLSRWVALLPSGSEADVQLRRLARLAEQQLDDPAAAMTAWLGVQTADADDIAQLIRCGIAAQRFATLAERADVVAALTPAQRQEGFAVLVEQRALPQARLVAQAHMADLLQAGDLLGAQTLWQDIGRAWRAHGQLRALCGWQLSWSEQYAEQAPRLCCTLAMEALLALPHCHSGAEQGEAAPQPTSQMHNDADNVLLARASDSQWQLQVLQRADLSQPNEALLAFRLAQASGAEQMRFAAAQALVRHSPPLAPGADAEQQNHTGVDADVLVAVAEACLLQKDCDQALRVIARLQASKDVRAPSLHIEALRVAGRHDELLALLQEQAEQASATEANGCWLRLAQQQAALSRTEQAASSLERVAKTARNEAWGALGWQIFEKLVQPQNQAHAAHVAGQSAQSAAGRALWQRREASVYLWQLADVEQGERLLRAAQGQQALHLPTLLQQAEAWPAQRAERALREALVVTPQEQQAPIWRRLAGLVKAPKDVLHALRMALQSMDDSVVGDGEELAGLVEAARRLDDAPLLSAALAKQAAWAGEHRLQDAAVLWQEAARLAPAEVGCAYWTQAAQARFALGERTEAAALTKEALALPQPPAALWPLVWALLPNAEARPQAAYQIVSAVQLTAYDDAERYALYTLAATHLIDSGQAQKARQCLLQASAAERSLPPQRDAALTQQFFACAQRVFEAQNDGAALVALWRRASATAQLPADVAQARLRRAASIGASLLPPAQVRALWLQVLAQTPQDSEAMLQLWALGARSLRQLQAHASQECQAAAEALLLEMETCLQAIDDADEQVHMTVMAAELWLRHMAWPAMAIRLLGRAFSQRLQAWQQQHEATGDAHAAAGEHAGGSPEHASDWQALVHLAQALQQRLQQAQRPQDALAVASRLALLAPADKRLPLLQQAGAMAAEQGDEAQAFRLWWPVAQNDACGAPWQFCLAQAQKAGQAEQVIALLTARARRAQSQEAARCLAEAARWAERRSPGKDEATRFLEASFALQREPRILSWLMQRYLQAGDASALVAAAQLYDPACLPAEQGQAIGLALLDSLQELPDNTVDAAIDTLWQQLMQAYPQMPQARAYRLQQAQARAQAALASDDHEQAQQHLHSIVDALEAQQERAAPWAQSWQQLARLQLQKGAPQEALETLESGLALYENTPQALGLLQASIEAARAASLWDKAAEYAQMRAQQLDAPIEACAALREAAQIYRLHLADWRAAATCLWQIVAAGGPPADDTELAEAHSSAWAELWSLLDASEGYFGEDDVWTQRRLLAAEHLLSTRAIESLSAHFCARVARAYAPHDPSRAHTLFLRAEQAGSTEPGMRALWRDVAWQAGAWSSFVSLAEAEEAAMPTGEQDPADDIAVISRRVALAEAHARLARSVEAARPWLQRALACMQSPCPASQTALWRRTADMLAALPDLRWRAMSLYAEILWHTPLEVDVLRIAARLAGQQGDQERAWGLYACLLWLLPADEEARRFVEACRAQNQEHAQHSARQAQPRPLVKKVQQALEDVVAQGLLQESMRPTRAYDVAQLVRRDIEAVLAEMVPTPTGEPRAHALGQAPDALRLFRFAQSPAYFALRGQLQHPAEEGAPRAS